MSKLKRLLILYFSLILIIFTLLTACSENENIDVINADYNLLQYSDKFSVGAIGIAGKESETEVAFRGLFKSRDAKNIFKKLEKESTPSGKLYALIALSILDRDYYEQLLAQYAVSNERVSVFTGGCLGSTVTFKELISDPELRVFGKDGPIITKKFFKTEFNKYLE